MPDGSPCGDYDLFVSMMVNFGLTPRQVMAFDPAYIEELNAFKRAEYRENKRQREMMERKTRSRGKYLSP